VSVIPVVVVKEYNVMMRSFQNLSNIPLQTEGNIELHIYLGIYIFYTFSIFAV